MELYSNNSVFTPFYILWSNWQFLLVVGNKPDQQTALSFLHWILIEKSWDSEVEELMIVDRVYVIVYIGLQTLSQ